MSLHPKEDFEDRDEELLRATLSAPDGDLRAFEQLVRNYQKRIVADCRFLTRDENNSEDLAQEVFVKAFFGLRNFEGRSTFRHWLQRIKVNHCLNHLKKRDGKEFLTIDQETAESFDELQVPPEAEASQMAMGDRQRIAGILDSMPATLRVPLVMSDIDEMSNDEIATSLAIGLSAVKMRIKRAREYFRQRFEGEGKTMRGQASQ
jgi:RNA polymerase sigma-70 factor (ECF subfamily)